MTRCVVVGGSGYVGGELIRLLLGHPKVTVAAATSQRHAGRRVDSLHPNLRGVTDLVFTSPRDVPGCDVAFLAAGQESAIGLVRQLLSAVDCLIDLSPDFRLSDQDAYERYYGHPHAAPDLLSSFVPGLPEQHRPCLRDARRISVPGCMATAAVLALRPLARDGLVDGAVIVDGRIGSSGSGSAATQLNLHAERSGAMRVFAPNGHRHEAEIAQATGLAVLMSATGVEAVRGLQVLCHVQLTRAVPEREVRQLYRDSYANEPFVRVVTERRGLYRLPEPKILIGSNFCDVGFATVPSSRHVTVVAALDNLVKGGAGNAVQCLNIRMGWPERLGLEFPGLHPV
jgi:N-acetyl-gamma-glutamyl-phosphate/LysW-gamma-L-alpha-aminoadipyl-6-phosphate reductase